LLQKTQEGTKGILREKNKGTQGNFGRKTQKGTKVILLQKTQEVTKEI
jgi:hypothetical protein